MNLKQKQLISKISRIDDIATSQESLETIIISLAQSLKVILSLALGESKVDFGVIMTLIGSAGLLEQNATSFKQFLEIDDEQKAQLLQLFKKELELENDKAEQIVEIVFDSILSVFLMVGIIKS